MQAWHKFVDNLNKLMSEFVIDKWIRSLKIKKFDARNIYLEANDYFQINWLKEHLLPLAKKELKNNNSLPIKIYLSVKNEAPFKSTPIKKIIFTPDVPDNFYSFDNFYTDKKNELAVKLLKQISGYEKNISDDSFFNPIFLYGPNGSGKTHLLSATATELSKHGKKIFFVTAQTFTEHVVQAFRLGLLHDFRNTYRNTEVLIVDGVDLLAGKNATQEEFFHTFNSLHNLNRQIIISSTSSPSNLNIEQRLISRFEWGITLPLDTINQTEAFQFMLQNHEKHFSLNLSEETKIFLTQTFLAPNKLQTALQALLIRSSSAFSKTKIDTTTPLDIYHIKNLLADLIEKEQKKTLTTDSIIAATADYFGVSASDILGKSQTKEYTLPRQTAMYFCRQKLKIPYKKLGEIFNRDHSTVMSSIKFIEKEKTSKKKINYITSDLEKILKN